MSTFRGLLAQGNTPNVVVWHVCGLPWALTNSPEFATWIAIAGSKQATTRRRLFSNSRNSNSAYPAYSVVVLPSLVSGGDYSVSYDIDRALNVGGYNVGIGSQADYLFPGFNHSGLPCLDWQPTQKTEGAAWAVLGADIVTTKPSADVALASLMWMKNTDFGLADYINLCKSESRAAYLWVSQSCLECANNTLNDLGDRWQIDVRARMFDAPREDVLALSDKQRTIITNYPQGMAGLTAKLFGLYFDGSDIL